MHNIEEDDGLRQKRRKDSYDSNNSNDSDKIEGADKEIRRSNSNDSDKIKGVENKILKTEKKYSNGMEVIKEEDDEELHHSNSNENQKTECAESFQLQKQSFLRKLLCCCFPQKQNKISPESNLKK